MTPDKLEQLKGLVERLGNALAETCPPHTRWTNALVGRDDLADALTELSALPELLAEIERLTEEREVLHLAVCGDEDAPGYAASLSNADILRVLTENQQTARRDGELAWDGETANTWKSRALTAEAEIERLRGALEEARAQSADERLTTWPFV